MKNRILISTVVLCSWLIMGINGCDTPAPSVLGTWHALCESTNPVGSFEYYWLLETAAETDNPMLPFTSWEKLADGKIKKTTSYYTYDKSLLAIKNNDAENADHLFYVTETAADTLSLRGGDYSCTIQKSENPWNKAKETEPAQN